MVRRLLTGRKHGAVSGVLTRFGNLRITPGLGGLALTLLAATTEAQAAKTDVVTLVNGDKVTGEVKQLSQGLLQYKTDSMSTVSIEWVDVVRLASALTFQVEVKNGDFYYGSLLDVDEERVLRVGIGEFQIDLPLTEVINISRIKHGFWQTLDGSLSLGFQATKATEVVQLSLMGNVEQLTRKNRNYVNLRLAISSTAKQPTTKNNNLGFSRDWLLGHRYAVGGSIQFQQNDELGIDFRTLLGVNGTRAMIQAMRQRLYLSAGVTYNRENVSDGGIKTSGEAMLNFDWSIFKYKSPKTDFYFKWFVYPSLTTRGRVRSQIDTNVRQELVKDFFLNFTGVYSYDSDPPNEEAGTEDYAITAGLGWSF